MKYLYGKNVLITGGSSGIGLATSELLASKGYNVFAASRNPASDIRRFPGCGEIRPITLDVCDAESVDAAARSILAEEEIGVVIHCAGIGIASPAAEFRSAAVSMLMESNFSGVMRVNSRFLPGMIDRGTGLCIMIGSVAGVFPIPYQSHYSASKAALDSYAMALRMELSKYGVQVSLVLPGDTNTGFTDARKFVIEETSPHYDTCLKAVRKMEKDEMGGRPPDSVARIILKLCNQKNPAARKVVGIDYKLLVFLQRLLPYRVVETILRAIYLGG